MTEIALSLVDKQRTSRGNVIHTKTSGSILFAPTNQAIKTKWLEIICDLIAPEKRDNYLNIPGYSNLIQYWTRSIQRQWGRSQLHPNNKSYINPLEVYNNIIDKYGQWIDNMPSDARGDVNITTTWLWSLQELKHFLILKLDQNIEHLDKNIQYIQKDTKLVVQGPQWFIDWQNDLGFTTQTKSEILDTNLIFHPRRNLLVDASLIKESQTINANR